MTETAASLASAARVFSGQTDEGNIAFAKFEDAFPAPMVEGLRKMPEGVTRQKGSEGQEFVAVWRTQK